MRDVGKWWCGRAVLLIESHASWGGEPAMSSPIRKQISMFVPLSDWKALRAEAARRRTSMTDLCRTWMEPSMADLRRRFAENPALSDDTDEDDERLGPAASD